MLGWRMEDPWTVVAVAARLDRPRLCGIEGREKEMVAAGGGDRESAQAGTRRWVRSHVVTQKKIVSGRSIPEQAIFIGLPSVSPPSIPTGESSVRGKVDPI